MGLLYILDYEESIFREFNIIMKWEQLSVLSIAYQSNDKFIYHIFEATT